MTPERKKKIIVMLSVLAGCTAGIFLITYLLGLNQFLREEAVIPLRLQLAGFLFLAAAIAFVIIARVKKYENVLRGFFCFLLAGIVFFILCVAIQIAGKEISSSFLLYLYNIWTVLLRPAAYLIAPLIGVSEFLRKALLLIILTYCAGQGYLGIQKQKRFEKTVAEKKLLQQESDPHS